MGVLVPVKSFVQAKQRLSGVLHDEQRVLLAQRCAARVVSAAEPFDAFVVCDSDDARSWAESFGLHTILVSGSGLNPAVEGAVQSLADRGYDLAVVAHGDLPLATTFGHLVAADTVTVVPDYRYDGTNALVLPTMLAGRFVFQYGRGSFRKHVIEAIARWPHVRVVRDDQLAHDLDTPSDLADDRMEEVRRWLQTNPVNPH